MKQESPLHKKDKHRHIDMSAICAHVNKPTPAQIDARRRETDKFDERVTVVQSESEVPCGELGHSEEHAVAAPKESNPIREVAQTFVGVFGLGVAVVAIIFGLVGANPLPYALGAVMCLLGYLYLDGE